MKETFALNVEKHAENNYKQLFQPNLSMIQNRIDTLYIKYT